MPSDINSCTVIQHALAGVRLATLRDEQTDPETFRRALAQLGLLLLGEAVRPLETKPTAIRTPLARTTGQRWRREILLVPILRAGQGLIGLADQLLPEARIGYLGMARDEKTLQPEWYLEKLPPRLSRYEVMICDPMLATGGSAVAAGQRLQQRGAKRLHFLHALAAPEGIRTLRKAFPMEPVYLGAVDERLNENGYIHPGLGDAGDRCFGC